MSNLKKFRIKSYKINEKILKVEKLSLKIENKIVFSQIHSSFTAMNIFCVVTFKKPKKNQKINF